MDVDYAPRIRAERSIATSRVVLAAFSLLAVWLDPSTPAKYVQVTNLLLAGYVAYSVALAAVIWFARAPSTRLGLATHVIDLALFCVFVYLTEGPASPFFTYFIFSMVGATMRWQWRGAVWTAAVVLVAFNGIGLYAARVLRDPEFELDRFIIRSVYLVVLASLLAFLGAYEQRRRSEMSKLAAWPHVLPDDPALALRELLEHGARILAAPRVVVALEEENEPWLHLAEWHAGSFRQWREPPETFHPLVAEPLASANFLCLDVAAPAPLVLRASPTGPEEWRGPSLHPLLVARFAIKTVLSLDVRGECVAGRLFCLDRRRLTADDLVLGEVVARHITESLDHLVLSHRLQDTAATEERIRLSRDLHDGVLQSLTGAALKLEAAQRVLERDPAAARGSLAEVQRLIAEEQRNLRFFIRGSRLDPLGATPEATLDARLYELGRRLETVWGLQVALQLEGLDGTADSLASEICHIVQEALINAARHAEASEVRVTAGAHDGRVDIVVADNGRGFPFRGDFDHEALTAGRLGPVMLKARIESLGGTLAIQSSPAGARLEIHLPCPRAA